MQATLYSLKSLAKATLLFVALAGSVQTSVYAAEADQESALADLKANQARVVEAQAAKDVAAKTRDALLAQQASKPSPDTERKLKDAEYEVMMADRKLSSAAKAVERVQKKLDENQVDLKIPQPAIKAEKPAVASDDIVKKASEDQARKEAEAKVAAQKASEERVRKEAESKLAVQKAAEEQLRKEAEAKLAAQKASEEQAKRTAEAAAAAKKQALAAELGIDKNCLALPAVPTNPSSSLNEAEQAYAQGFLKQVNQLVAKKTADDVPPISPSPVLEGTKLNPCEPDQKLALKFGYMGNGQYRVETPVLAGEQVFTVKNVQPLNRTIPESDNGEVYVFFLDGREGRTKLTAYKKSLLGQATE